MRNELKDKFESNLESQEYEEKLGNIKRMEKDGTWFSDIEM